MLRLPAIVVRPASDIGSSGVTTDGPLVAIAFLPPSIVTKFCLVPNASAVTAMSANTAKQSSTRASGDLTIYLLQFFCWFRSGLLETLVRIRGVLHCLLLQQFHWNLPGVDGRQKSGSYPVAGISCQLTEDGKKLRAESGRNLTYPKDSVKENPRLARISG